MTDTRPDAGASLKKSNDRLAGRQIDPRLWLVFVVSVSIELGFLPGRQRKVEVVYSTVQGQTMSLQTLISAYGYPAVAVGTFFEGETVLVLAGFASHRGYLELQWVVVSAFLGTLLGDQLYFYLGRVKGTKALKNRPHWMASSERVLDLLRRHQLSLILGFRFLYGLRTVTPFLLGASGVPPLRFLVLNVLGAFLWAVSIGVSGYLFGQVLELLIGKVEHYELLLFVALAAVGAVSWGLHWFNRRKALRQPTEPRS